MPPIQMTSSSTFDFSSVMKKAFIEAKNKDADEVRRVCSARSGNAGKFYAVSKQWMKSFLAYIDHGYPEPGSICNNHLVERIVTVEAVPIVDEPSIVEDDNLFGDDELQGITLDYAGSQVDKVPNILINGLVAGKDYFLVGDAVWTLLSSKFGFDQILSFETRFLMAAEKEKWIYKSVDMSDLVVEVYPFDRQTTSFENFLVPIPKSGYFDYSIPETNALSRLIVDYAETDDIVPFAKTEVSYNDDESMPILLLPPSTTGQPVDEVILGSFKRGEAESFSALRKRKRYGAGLGNLGNTCFMNATLQCLAHTWPLRQYFLSGQFRDDLNRENPLGTGGELAIEFAKLLEEMWGLSNDKEADRNTLSSYQSSYKWWSPPSESSSQSAVVYPRSFKYALGKHAEQFMGYDQHDSQELATFLLDALHEDTNRITKKPYIEKPEQGEMETDDEAAAKSWSLHLKRENSRVLENFMGQVKSRVECPRAGCGRVSTTFDPFMYLSVPIPGATNRTISFVYVPLNPLTSAKDLHVVVSKSSTILQLRQAIAITLNALAFEEPVLHDDLVLAEIYSNEIYRYFSDTADISIIRDLDKIFVFRVIPKSLLSAESPATLSEPPHLPLDDAVITELTTDDKWRLTLENYVKQPLKLVHVLNSRTSLDERLDFLESARSLLERCFHCPECVAYRRNWERKVKHETASEDYHVTPIDSLKPSVSEVDARSEASIEERCYNSKIFKNIRNAVDVATLEFCSRKLYQLCKEMQLPGEIQIVFMKPFMAYSSFRREEAFGFPLVLRISSSLTVYDFRKLLADRLSPHFSDKSRDEEKSNQDMQDDDFNSLYGYDSDPRRSDGSSASLSPWDIMRQVHLQYERYNSIMRHSAYRTLGATFSMDEKHTSTSQRLAFPDDEAEQKSVLDIVGNQGKVVISFPDHIYRHNLNVRQMFRVESGRSIQASDTEENRTTVLQCIRKYCQKEQLEETDMWYCDRCKEHVPAWKEIGLYRLPPILIVHLKRFQFSATTHRRSKIETPIDFPLIGLDLRGEAKHWLEGEEPIYDCYALTNHFGGLGGGHYTAFAQNDDGEWCGFDDSRVTTGLSTNSIVTPAAYVLYYKRRDVTLPIETVMIENPPLVMDVDDDRLSNNDISMDKSSPSVDIIQQDASSLENEPADDRDDSILNTSIYTI